ncbi:MAG TPA: DUF4097 family beta strand repeat-containing protein [Gemmatimonadales bacterium]|jgi:DUF4097 and DUF4098 domain-containing protein YvlB|nr:DUF4097 family beta strand repeat-containing protein [Gemmatimonadales bacterium]
MRIIRHLTLAALAATPCGSALAAQDFSWKGALAAGQTLEIRGINGDIRAGRASGPEAQVTAVKRGKRSDPGEVTIEVVEHAGGVTICAVYPAGRGRANRCRPGGGKQETRGNDVEVNFDVRVPAGVRFEGTTVNGSIVARDLASDAHVTTVNGDLEVATKGLVEATTANGSIEAAIGRADWEGDLEFAAVNGSITLTLPAALDADLEASTVNGSIETDFPLTVQGRFGPSTLKGTLGKGGRHLKLTTANGSIRLKKAS